MVKPLWKSREQDISMPCWRSSWLHREPQAPTGTESVTPKRAWCRLIKLSPSRGWADPGLRDTLGGIWVGWTWYFSCQTPKGATEVQFSTPDALTQSWGGALNNTHTSGAECVEPPIPAQLGNINTDLIKPDTAGKTNTHWKTWSQGLEAITARHWGPRDKFHHCWAHQCCCLSWRTAHHKARNGLGLAPGGGSWSMRLPFSTT